MKSLQAAWADSKARPALPLGSPAPAVYGFTLVYLLACYLGASDLHPNWLFREGGLLDCLSTLFLMTGAVLAWFCARASRGRRREIAFFSLSALGLAVMSLTERFQLHEHLDEQVLRLTEVAPFFGKNWNDVIVVAYGVGALIGAVLALETILRHRALRNFLLVGFACYVLHSLIDLAFTRTQTTDLFEEPFKVLAGASFMLAYLQTLRDKAATWDAGQSDRRWPRFGWPGMALLFGFGFLFELLASYPNAEWQRLTHYKWGYPFGWMIMLLFGLAAIAIALSEISASRDSTREVWFWRAAAAIFGLLALGETTFAAKHRFSGAFQREVLSRAFWSEIDMLHQSLNLKTALLVLLLLMFLVAGRHYVTRHSRARILSGLSAVLLILLVGTRTLFEHTPPAALPAGRIAATLLLLAAAVAATSAGLALLLGRAEDGHPRPPS